MYKIRRLKMEEYEFLYNGKHTRCVETVVTFKEDGEVAKVSNPKYIPNKPEHAVCRLLGWLKSNDESKVEKAEKHIKMLYLKAVSEGVRL
jgi:hypothetical protein